MSEDPHFEMIREMERIFLEECPAPLFRGHVPLSVRNGGRRKRINWWIKGKRQQLALRLAPWLRVS